MSTSRVLAPAKLTWSLAIGDRRPDGYHDLSSEMVTLDLFDELTIIEPGSGIVLSASSTAGTGLSLGPDNLIARALALAGREASVELIKRVPPGGGLGGGSADAGAILRWAGWDQPAAAVTLGGDVPFCVLGGRAMVHGVGEVLEPLDHVDRTVVLLLPPLVVPTADAYRALDELRLEGAGRHERNDLTAAAERAVPRMAAWRRAFESMTGAEAVLAGSGSTLFVEGSLASLGCEGAEILDLDGEVAKVLEAATVPASVGVPELL